MFSKKFYFSKGIFPHFFFFNIYWIFVFCFFQNFNVGETNEARSIELPVSTPFFFFPSPLLYFHFLISPVVELGSTFIGERGCVLLRLPFDPFGFHLLQRVCSDYSHSACVPL